MAAAEGAVKDRFTRKSERSQTERARKEEAHEQEKSKHQAAVEKQTVAKNKLAEVHARKPPVEGTLVESAPEPKATEPATTKPETSAEKPAVTTKPEIATTKRETSAEQPAVDESAVAATKPATEPVAADESAVRPGLADDGAELHKAVLAAAGDISGDTTGAEPGEQTEAPGGQQGVPADVSAEPAAQEGTVAGPQEDARWARPQTQEDAEAFARGKQEHDTKLEQAVKKNKGDAHRLATEHETLEAACREQIGEAPDDPTLHTQAFDRCVKDAKSLLRAGHIQDSARAQMQTQASGAQGGGRRIRKRTAKRKKRRSAKRRRRRRKHRGGRQSAKQNTDKRRTLKSKRERSDEGQKKQRPAPSLLLTVFFESDTLFQVE